MKQFEKFYRDESAATAIEYGLIASLISATIIGGLNSVSGEIVSMWEYLGDTID